MDIDDDDEELYGTKRIASYSTTSSFHDSPHLRLEKSKRLESKMGVLALLNRYGPFQDYAVGLAATDKVQWANRPSSFPLQLVSSTGSGPDGSLSIIQESVWPHIITSFPMSACDEIFTLQLRAAARAKKSGLHEGQIFLVLSSATSSMASIRV